MIGQLILGRYKVTRLLDEGGMSRVYLARQTDPARDVVVKVLKDDLINQAKTCEHFRREIHILSHFKHPHAVGYVDSSTRELRGPILVMEYLRGVDLNILLQRDGRFTPERAGRLLVQLCDVLQAAHDAGIVHRDIKPGNLMILYPNTPQETVKLMDFGLAKMTSLLYISPDDLLDFNLPAASGTPEYIAPEMVRGNDMDARGDIYSVGVLLFEMLLGRRPFVSSRAEDLMRAHRDLPPPLFCAVGPPDLVPEAIERVVQSCLAKHPDQRPINAWELALAYERALGKRLTFGRAHTPALSQITPPAGQTRAIPTMKPSSPSPLRHNGAKPMMRPSGAAPVVRAPAPEPALPPADRNALRQKFEANMPEAMAMVKLKGFIFDLGGEVIESTPGMIRVRIEEAESKPSGGLFGWIGGGSKRPAAIRKASATDLELHMERPDPSQPGRLTITLILRASGGLMTPELRTRCQQIGRDLQAYLMG
jgi:serine/threonine-protein kinase